MKLSSGCGSMKQIIGLACLVVVSCIAMRGHSGCALTQSQSEHWHTYDTIVHHDIYMIPDDWDAIWEMDRPTRLSKWLITY